ncbi:hypothetical protein [Thalassomonas sp. RHCl1]|uniref:hypothetical protein n=1 Tax=Thalassomonas sp. RHCl1 TaxID=2995320 RepID=UPI00248AC5B4|nr:hypothetical protein [Thalassomonas sp. RHCl1]
MSDEAIKIANQLLESDDDYLDNVIKLWKLGNKLYGQCWDTDFHIFGVIESDTDHLPLKHVRVNCSAEFLMKSDKELAEIREFYRADVVSACNKILKWSKSV